MNNVWLALITGLTTGGISCLAVQGGLLASSVTGEVGKKTGIVTTFLLFKILAYTVMGAGLGLLGASLTLSPNILGLMQILAGLFMLATAARLLDIHPIFRYFVIQPPKFALRLIRNQSYAKSFFTPAVLGAMTVFIPCGVTQAMMILAISSGGAFYGALIMFAFTLGTSPIFFAIGLAIVELLKRKVFVYAASFVIIIFGLMAINAGQGLRGSVHTFQNYSLALKSVFGENKVLGKIAPLDESGNQLVTLNAAANGYTTDVTTLKLGVPVKMTVNAKNVVTCAKSFLIPSLKLAKILPENGTDIIEFTPTKEGLLSYTCGMGMYTGSLTVIE